MTGLHYVADALIEIACVVTDFDLNPLADGVDLVIKPPAAALEQMDDFVRTMHERSGAPSHERSGLLDELDAGIRWQEPEQQVLDYVRKNCADGPRPPLAGNS